MNSIFFGHTIFCDDIRYEIGGKISYIGVYSGVIFGATFPLILPHFSMATYLYMPGDVQPSSIEYLVYLPDDENVPAHREIVPQGGERKKIVPDAKESDLRGVVRKAFAFAPMNLRTEGRIKVRAMIGDEIIKAGSLYVRLNKLS